MAGSATQHITNKSELMEMLGFAPPWSYIVLNMAGEELHVLSVDPGHTWTVINITESERISNLREDMKALERENERRTLLLEQFDKIMRESDGDDLLGAMSVLHDDVETELNRY